MHANPYLNFQGDTEAAFDFYAAALGAEIENLVRFRDLPPEGVTIPDEDQDKVMHVALPLGDGQRLMGSDALESLDQHVAVGNNLYISLHADSREEADRLFAALSDGGAVEMAIDDMPGATIGAASTTDSASGGWSATRRRRRDRAERRRDFRAEPATRSRPRGRGAWPAPGRSG